jgi:hypothetical protein
MLDSYDTQSFRRGWLPVGRSGDVTLNFQAYATRFSVRPNELYYFKPLETFDIEGMSLDEKFEDIDSYIVQAFDCDPDDIITLNSERCRGVIVMPESTLRVARVELPKWPETRSHTKSRRAHARWLSLAPVAVS